MTNNTEHDVSNDIGNQVSGVAKAGTKKAGKKLASKAGGSIARTGARKVAMAIAHLAAQLVAIIIQAVLALWWLLLAIAAVILICFIITWMVEFFNNEQFLKQKYGGSGKAEVSEYKYDIDNISTDSILNAVYYRDIASKSYYVTIEDKDGNPMGGIFQAGTQQWLEFQAANNIYDIDNREGQFAISAESLMVLDKNLNSGYSYPEQFLKPVYNDCLTGQNTFANCRLLDLEENGKVVALSRYYAKRPDAKTQGAQPGGEYIETMEVDNDTDYLSKGSSYYDPNDSVKTNGVWDWGLASMVHYKQFEEDSKVDDYKIQTFSYWDSEKRTLVQGADWQTTSDSKRQEAIDRYGIVVPNVTFDTSGQNSAASGTYYTYSGKDGAREYQRLTEQGAGIEPLYPLIPEDELKYAITGAVTFLGSVNNTPYQTYIEQGDTYSKALITDHKETYTGLNESSLKNNDWSLDPKGNRIVRLVKNGQVVAESTNLDLTISYERNRLIYTDQACVDNINAANKPGKPTNPGDLPFVPEVPDIATCDHREDGYWFDGGWYQGSIGEFYFERDYLMDIEYTKKGTLYTNTLLYATDEPDTSNIVGFNYLEQYIDNYRAFIPTSLTEDVRCYDFNTLGQADALAGGKNHWSTQVINRNTCDENGLRLIENGYGSMDTIGAGSVSLAQYDHNLNSVGLELSSKIYESNISSSSIDISEMNLEDNAISDAINANKPGIIDVEKKYGAQMKKMSIQYGVSYPLLLAIAKQESNGNHNNYISQDRCRSGCGLMQIENPVGNPGTITAYNFNTRKDDSIDVNYQNAIDVNLNIQMAAMKLQNLLIYYKYNTLLAIQAYNFGQGAVDILIDLYLDESGLSRGDVINNPLDIGWTKYRKELYSNPAKYIAGASEPTWGDYQYLEHVLGYVGQNALTFQNATPDAALRHTSVNFVAARLIDAASKSTEFANNADRIYNRAWRALRGNKNYQQNILLLTQGHKNAMSGTFDLSGDIIAEKWLQPEFVAVMQSEGYWLNIEDQLTYITVFKNANGTGVNTMDVIYKMFAMAEATTVEDIKNESEQAWSERFAGLFSSVDSRSWTSTLDFNKIISLSDSVRVIQRPYTVLQNYGRKVSKEGDKTKVEINTVLQTVPVVTEVYAFKDGFITSIIEAEELGATGYEITVEHFGSTENVIMTYQYVLPAPGIKKGMEVKTGDILGYVDIDGLLGLTLELDNKYTDAMALMRAIEDEWRYLVNEGDGNLSINGGGGFYNEVLAQMNKELLLNGHDSLAPLGSWRLEDFVNTANGYVSAGTWFYPKTTAAHDAIDVAAPIGNELYAPTDVIVLSARDSCYHTNSGKNTNTSCNNFLVYLFEKDGYTYSTKVGHMQQGSIAKAGWQSNGTLVKKGELLGAVGNSGFSTGPHAHIRINRLGDQGVDYWVQNYIDVKDETFGLGFVSGKNTVAVSKRCESNRSTPCVEAPDVLFTGSHKQ